ADADLTARVLQADTQGVHHRTRAGGIAGAWLQWHGLVTVSAAAVVVALLAGVLAFVHPGGLLRPAGGVTGTSTVTATATPISTKSTIVPITCRPTASPPATSGTVVDHSVAVGRAASIHGITITIDRAYADATQTVITYHLQTTINPPLPALPVLLDAQGHRYAEISGDWDIDHGGNAIFTPLPSEELGTPQRLTFFTQQMRLANPTGSGAFVDGPWQISFTLTPAAGTAQMLNIAPLTHNGLTIQPLRLDIAPPGGGLDGATGGARVVVRISGLAPGMPLINLLRFDTLFDLGGGGGYGCGGSILELAPPNGQPLVPGNVRVLGQTVPITDAEQQPAYTETVGPSGAADVEAVFYTPIPLGAGVTLYMDRVMAQIAGADKPERVSGPWTFQLVPNA
ncbi:MAG TPA: DUF4179 domain-containing protein, partial [Ktedonobacterales bacterium]|nr:DUF4179 domain-containing protein [Ktedonobacterales bacterium]